jgi:hypothetical protein
MSTIGTAASYANDIATPPLSDPTDTQAPATAPSAPAGGTADTTSDSRDPATRVDLSDKVKAILAQASSDQEVADRLKAFVASHRTDGGDGSAQNDPSNNNQSPGVDVETAFEQLSGGTQANDDSDDSGPVQPAQNFATGLEADGYTISAVGRASDGSYQIEIIGPDGTGFLDRRFGASAEFSGFSNLGPGMTAQEYQQGNQEYITFSQNVAAATSVSATSDAGTVSATSSGTLTSAVTFEVDFDTGAISMTQSESLSVSTAVQVSQPGSTFSTVA